MRQSLFILFMIVFSDLTFAGNRVMWWNVENLFDCHHDSLKNDMEFLPEGSYHWTPSRFWHKIDNISRTIAAVAEDGDWPMIIGLCEVENDSALIALTRRGSLRAAGYEFIHEEGLDLRGVDVALLYHPRQFLPIGHQAVRVPSLDAGLRPTRDILHVWGRVVESDDTLHVFVVHFPSRAGGSLTADRNRRLAQETLCASLDSVRGQCVMLMGDFNAEPGNPIFSGISQRLVSLMPQRRRELRRAMGTYFFQGQWGFLDHIFVSHELKPRVEARAHVARFPFLLTEQGTPWRTYQGPVYKGGYSDHLPLYVDLKLK